MVLPVETRLGLELGPWSVSPYSDEEIVYPTENVENLTPTADSEDEDRTQKCWAASREYYYNPTIRSIHLMNIIQRTTRKTQT